MKNWSPALQAAYAQPASTITQCVCIQPVTRTPVLDPIAFTAHDRDLVVNGVTYRAVSFSPVDAVAAADLGVDQSELQAYFQPAGITSEDIEGGIYDGAEVEVFEVDFTAGEFTGTADSGDTDTIVDSDHPADGLAGWEVVFLTGANAGESRVIDSESTSVINLTPALDNAVSEGDQYRVRQGRNILVSGTLGKIRFVDSGSVVFEMDSLKRQLQQQVTNKTQPTCVNDFGDEWCGVDVDALGKAGTIDSVGSRVQFTDAARTEDDGYWRGGVVRITSGDNAGYRREVRSFSQGVVTLIDPFPFALETGDDYVMTPTCFKRLFADCRDTWDNVENFRGMPNMRGDRALKKLPEF